jgi:K+/H+ antiporter YhaU regulatory subunit KhtT
MRKVSVQHERLPGVGESFELVTTSGFTVTVVNHHSGRRDIAIRGRGADDSLAIASLTDTEAAAIALLLTGAYVEVTTASGD